MNQPASSRVLFLIALVLGFITSAQVSGTQVDVCAICGAPIIDVYYGLEDRVTLEKKHICKQCELSFPVCFVCGLPANTNSPGFMQLPDSRVLCSRDARTAVLNEEDGVRICREVRDGLDRLFSRFTSFPETNVTVRVMDRVNLLGLFKLLGNDYQCPNVWGVTQTEMNHDRLQYRISLMTGLPLAWFQGTCAHEYGHTWVSEHLSIQRRARLDRDAEEGFCELVAFLFAESVHDEQQKAMLLRNAYTRGQIDQFVGAVQTYGFEEVLDWMQFGIDARLSATEPGRIRQVAMARAIKWSPVFALLREPLVPAPDTLVLKGIIWDEKHPLALINDRAFSPDEQAQVRLGATNVLVRCIRISPEGVQLRVADAPQQQTLRLKSR